MELAQNRLRENKTIRASWLACPHCRRETLAKKKKKKKQMVIFVLLQLW